MNKINNDYDKCKKIVMEAKIGMFELPSDIKQSILFLIHKIEMQEKEILRLKEINNSLIGGTDD